MNKRKVVEIIFDNDVITSNDVSRFLSTCQNAKAEKTVEKYVQCLDRILIEAKKDEAYVNAKTIEVLDPDFVCKIIDKISYSPEGKLLSKSTPEQFRSAIMWFYRKV